MTIEQYEQAKEEYIRAIRTSGKSAVTAYNYYTRLADFGEYLRKNAGNKNEITPLDVIKYADCIAERGVKTNTVRAYLVTLKVFFDFCVRMKLMDKNLVTVEDIPEQKPIDNLTNILPREDIEKILAYTDKPKGSVQKNVNRNRAILVLLILTGLRNTELRKLTPADLNFEDGTIEVKKGKGGKKRTVAFPKQAREAVRTYLNTEFPKNRNENDILFGSHSLGRGWSYQEWHEMTAVNLNYIVKQYIEKVVGKDAHTHTMRHCYASLCDHKGVSLRNIQLSMGHSSPITTDKVYISVLDGGKAARTVNAVFDEEE